MIKDQHLQSDIQVIVSHRFDNGADLWTTPDRRLLKGAPFSTVESVLHLSELGVQPDNPLLQAAASLLWQAWKDDGRFRVYPQGGIYPCQTAHVANALCRLGYAEDDRLRKTFQHFLATQYPDGGWRCNKFSFGRGPETECSNPFPTLVVLDAFRYAPSYHQEPALDRAVEFLLGHWTIRKPIGPCHYGMGTLFMQVEYPFRNYNLFYYVYVLSFYPRARRDSRFQDALQALRSKTVGEEIVVERVVPKMAGLYFCQKGQPSALATLRFQEIEKNMEI